MRIHYLGGAPKVMPTFDVGKNLRDGLFDIMNNTGAYYTNVVPEADALKLFDVPMAELTGRAAAGIMSTCSTTTR